MGQAEAAIDRVPSRERRQPGVIFPKPNVGEVERLASAAAGGAMVVLGLRRRDPLGFAAAAVGGLLVARGATGHCPAYGALGVDTAAEACCVVHVEATVTVHRPREMLFTYWRDLSNLPRFLRFVDSVIAIGDTRSHWTATVPGHDRLGWDAEIYAEKRNALISWRTSPDSQIHHKGSVRFTKAPGGRGTEVRLTLELRAPGPTGAALARLFGELPEEMLREDLRRFRSLMEAGELPRTEGQPSGRGAR